MDDEQKLVEGIYEDAEEETKDIYKEQKKARDELLNQLALIMLTYNVLDGLMSLTRKDKVKEYSRLSKLIKSNCKATGKVQEDVINKVLTNTANNTFDFYSYNKGLKDVQAIIDKNFKEKHFSERVWENENQVASHLHKQTNDFLNGKVNVNQIKKDIEKTYNTSAYNAKRLVETEVARVQNDSFKRFCLETGVKQIRRNAVLDKKTCDDCSSFDGKIYDLKSAPDLPAHPCCRCFYEIADGESNAKDLTKEGISNNKQIKSFDKSHNMEYTGDKKEDTPQKSKKNGATRAEEFSKYWEEVSLKESINKFVPNATASEISPKGKVIYKSNDTKLQIVYDTKGNYFRIEDTSRTDKKRYLDIDGNDVSNIIENGKKRGTSKLEYQSSTHFKNSDKEG